MAHDTLCISKSCKMCDIGYILKDYVNVLIQALTNDIVEFNMENLTTKCLNTAVMIMFFLLGKNGIDVADACDCSEYNKKSRDRLEQGYTQQNSDILQKLKLSILSKSDKKRQLYYIMLTDSYLQINESHEKYFPGHVIVVEKVPLNNEAKDVYYNMYQSYVNEYDLKGYYEKSKDTFYISYNKMKEFLGALAYIFTTSTWDTKCVELWKNITYADSKDFVGYDIKNKFFICYQKVEAKYCFENLEEYAVRKLEQLESPSVQPNIVYGDPSKYRYSGIDPLTNYEAKIALQQLIKSIKNRKMS